MLMQLMLKRSRGNLSKNRNKEAACCLGIYCSYSSCIRHFKAEVLTFPSIFVIKIIAVVSIFLYCNKYILHYLLILNGYNF